MKLGEYQLLAQIGAGRDGASYRCRHAPDESPALVRTLDGARANPERWGRLTARLRLAAMLNHPAAAPIRDLCLEGDRPYVAMDWPAGQPLGNGLRNRTPLSLAEAAPLILTISEVLTAAHRLGLSHCRLLPNSVRLTDAREILIDFSDIDAGDAGDGDESAEFDAARRPPERDGVSADVEPDRAGNVYCFGVLLRWLCGDLLNPIVREMLAADPGDRPSMPEIHERLLRMLGAAETVRDTGGAFPAINETAVAPTFISDALDEEPEGRLKLAQQLLRGAGAECRVFNGMVLGRYRLLEECGHGGMGAVYRAQDESDGSIVAVKVLRPDCARSPQALRRFRKEARLLREVDNPFVTRFLEMNEADGIHYLVVEFVVGKTVAELLRERGPLPEPEALAIISDVCRALADAHRRGIVHRDVKPDNILLVAEPDTSIPCLHQPEGASPRFSPIAHEPGASAPRLMTPRVKLSDFGLARHVEESESLHITGTGAILGTPLFMSPEQCAGGATDPRSDVYSIGATLFCLLAGRPPFEGPTPQSVIVQHGSAPPPALEKLNAAVSEAVCRIIEKTLAKSPEHRYPDAATLLDDVQRVLRGEPTGIAVHPRLPTCDPRNVVCYNWSWELESPPDELWPHVSNTERFNRAVGIPAVEFTTEVDAGSHPAAVRRLGRFRKFGMAVAWREHPFEWIELQRFGVFREYSRGPLKWLVSTVELTPRPGGGTSLVHRVRLEPTGLVGRIAAALEVGVRGRRAADRVYRRIDAALRKDREAAPIGDLFEEPMSLPRARGRRLERLLQRLQNPGISEIPGFSTVIRRLGEFLAEAAPQDVARIRPIALARRLQVDVEALTAACLLGAREGLLLLQWDILCPVCRVASDALATLRSLRDHAHCPACNLDFETDLAASVELVFRAHPDIRETDVGTYCIGGPVHSPHVVAQVRVAAGERCELHLTLREGAYRLRGPQLPFAIDLRVTAAAAAARAELNLSRGPGPETSRVLQNGGQVLALVNEGNAELLVRLERSASRDDALTAARALSSPAFRDMFPHEVLASGNLAGIGRMTLLAVDLDDAASSPAPDASPRAFTAVHESLRRIEQHVRERQGAVVKSLGNGLLAAFQETLRAVQAALDLPAALDAGASSASLNPRIGVHRGPCTIATINDRLDYFGPSVTAASRLPQFAAVSGIVLSQAVASDPDVAALLESRRLEAEIVAGTGFTSEGDFPLRVVPSTVKLVTGRSVVP